MAFKAELDCPQCGAPLELDEADRLLDCPFCGTKNFLSVPDYFRFVLPHKQTDNELVYVPYLRFRGSVFSCQPTLISHRIADITHLGTPLSVLPPSLGFRPQAMKLRFATPELPGTFLKNFLDVDKALDRIGTYSDSKAPVYHRAHIGEVMSLIYLPLTVKNNRIYDAVSDDALARFPDDKDFFASFRDLAKNWQMNPLATLCPQCGWNLTGDRGSVALSCDNCNTLWEATGKGFSRIPFISHPTNDIKNTLFMPFWRITAGSNAIRINSFADFVRATNQPRLPKKAWEKVPMNFWCPAFKIRPKVFLQLASQLTTSQSNLAPSGTMQKGGRLYPVTLPKSEAVQSLKIILANSSASKKKIMPLLPETRFSISDIVIAYVPFIDHGYSLFQDEVRANLNKKILGWADRL